MVVVTDTFERVATCGWGSTDTNCTVDWEQFCFSSINNSLMSSIECINAIDSCGAVIDSGRATISSAGPYHTAEVLELSPVQDIEIIANTVWNGSECIGILCRVIDSDNFIIVNASPGFTTDYYLRVEIIEVVAGSATELDSQSSPSSIVLSGAELKVIISGTTLDVYVDGNLTTSGTISLTGTKYGLMINAAFFTPYCGSISFDSDEYTCTEVTSIDVAGELGFVGELELLTLQTPFELFREAHIDLEGSLVQETQTLLAGSLTFNGSLTNQEILVAHGYVFASVIM